MSEERLGTSGNRRRVGTLRAGTIVCVVALCAMSARASAQPALDVSSPDRPRPWAAGVSKAEQAAALELYVAGNHEFAESRHVQALARYKLAIQHWDHPAIHYNMVVCLISLDQPVEARDHLERSLAYGAGPLGEDAYQQAMTYRKLLDAQLSHVRLSCPEPGAEVTLDGKLLFTGPGAAERFVLPGTHQVAATKPGRQPAFETLTLTAGKQTTRELQPSIERRSQPRMVRRWSTWTPWTMLGGGVALLGSGALAYALAARNISTYDADVHARCPKGCNAEKFASFTDLQQRKDRAGTEQRVAFSLLPAGGVAVVVGVVVLVLNQPRPEVGRTEPIVTPLPGGATVSIRGSF